MMYVEDRYELENGHLAKNKNRKLAIDGLEIMLQILKKLRNNNYRSEESDPSIYLTGHKRCNNILASATFDIRVELWSFLDILMRTYWRSSLCWLLFSALTNPFRAHGLFKTPLPVFRLLIGKIPFN